MLKQVSFWHGLSVGMEDGSGSHVPGRSCGLSRHRGAPCFAASAPDKGNFASSLGTRRNACWAVADSWMSLSGKNVWSDLLSCLDHKITIKKRIWAHACSVYCWSFQKPLSQKHFSRFFQLFISTKVTKFHRENCFVPADNAKWHF